MKEKAAIEWFYQSSYDLETANAMFSSKRYVYTIFMCHLSIEKALKGLIAEKLKIFPSKTHNLLYLIEKLSLELKDKDKIFVNELNDISVPTRYPEDLRKLIKVYTKNRTGEILDSTKTFLKWLKKQSTK